MTFNHTHNFRAVTHPLRIHSGERALESLPAELDRLKLTRAYILCGRSIALHTSLLDDITVLLGSRLAGTCTAIGADVDREAVEAAAQGARDCSADCLIAIGAGSTTKACRVVAIRIAEAGPLETLATQYDGSGIGRSVRLSKEKLPIFNVLTAATTSQNRSGASIKDTRANRQLEFFDPKTRARAVFWDARALQTAPISLTRSAAGMEYWWALMNLAGARHENPLVLASRRQSWQIASQAMSRVHDPENWQVRVELCAASLLRTRDEDDGGAPLGVLPGSHVIRMHPITRATYMLGQGLANTGSGVSQSQATMALAGVAVSVFGEFCPEVVQDIARLLNIPESNCAELGDQLTERLRNFGFAADLRDAGLSASQCEHIVDFALRTFNCNADGWMNDKTDKLLAMLASVS